MTLSVKCLSVSGGVSSRILASFFCLLLLLPLHAQQKDDVDVLVLSNGDTLHGKLVNAIADKVTFHTDPLGDVTVDWGKVRELHSSQKFAVLEKNAKVKHHAAIPSGAIDVANDTITLQPANAASPQTIPVKQAEYVVDYPTIDKQINHNPGFFTGWNGAITAGGTLVQATQSQYTVSAGMALVRVVPSVTWLNPRNRTSATFSGSYGKITEQGTPAVKSSLFHFDAERDEYLSQRIFVLAQTAFDHNFAQDLDLQQIYGGGVGWTIISTAVQEADLKATLQYERQRFISTGPGTENNLVGSTIAANYMRHLKLFTYAQSLAYIPSFNDPHAYSAIEVNSFTFPAYKNFSLTMGTTDSYLNNPPVSLVPPQTKRNSFQFTMGLSYAIKSKY
jgi:hypothetical protein